MEQLVAQLIAAASAQEIIAAASAPAVTEQFFTVAGNGIILEASETITGILPNALLTTSIYDGVHHEDLLGFRTVKEKMWDKGNFDIAVNLRRKNVIGEWIWLVSKVVASVVNPVPSIILHECRAEDDIVASFFAKLTWLIASLSKSLDKAHELSNKNDSSVKKKSRRHGNLDSSEPSVIPGLAEEAAKLQALLRDVTGNSGAAIDDDTSARMQRIFDSAIQGGALPRNPDNAERSRRGDIRSSSTTNGTYVIPTVLDLVSSGPCVNISYVELSPMELRLSVLVLQGKLSIENIILSIQENLKSKDDLSKILDDLLSENERRVNENKEQSNDDSESSRSNSSNIGNSSVSGDDVSPSLPLHKSLATPPNIASINLSCTRIGNHGLESIVELINCDNPSLKLLNLGFCNLEERDILALCRAIRKRKARGLPDLQGLILSGNEISYKSAKELGLALCLKQGGKVCQITHEPILEGYEEDNEGGRDIDDDDDDDDDIFGVGVPGLGHSAKRRFTKKKICNDSKKERKSPKYSAEENPGIQLLHLASTSLSSEALAQLMIGLGEDCGIRELSISSNNIGVDGTATFVKFMEGKVRRMQTKNGSKKASMPKLDRIDLSNNNLGDSGTAKLTRGIASRGQLRMVDLHLSFNGIGPGGTGTIMNKLLQHNLVTLFLDNNIIGDAGCQLVAGSLTSMHHLSRLNLSFNQIGSRGTTSLMRALIGCPSITYLGLSGNVMKISGAIAMGYALAQHPRLAHLEVDNCCLSEVAQCHIVSGIISNRWIPMRLFHGFHVAPAMNAIGVPEVRAWRMNNELSDLSNEVCFSMRRNIQMRTILQPSLQWMESRGNDSTKTCDINTNSSENLLTMDSVTTSNDVDSPPSQNAYLRMLDWLSRIPFDHDELSDLRRYFYDADDGGDGLRGSDGNINLKQRGDLLAALGSGLAEKLREEDVKFPDGPAVGLGIDSDTESNNDDYFECLWNGGGQMAEKSSSGVAKMLRKQAENNVSETLSYQEESTCENDTNKESMKEKSQNSMSSSNDRIEALNGNAASENEGDSESEHSANSGEEQKSSKSLKARITMFPMFKEKLERLESNAKREMDAEVNANQQDAIAQKFAVNHLTLLRQLKYHCMNNGLDGWRQGKTRRKVLIVDDSAVTRKLVARAFEKAKFFVDTAENGEEGFKMLQESIYDIAFMDINMPVMNGFDATKKLREWEDRERPGARQPICALTAAYVDDFDRQDLMKFKEAGLDVMESKPCNIPRLFKVVDDVSPMFSDLNISVTQQFNATPC